MNDITAEEEIKIIHDIQDDKEMFDAQMISNLKAENESLREILKEAYDYINMGLTPYGEFLGRIEQALSEGGADE